MPLEELPGRRLRLCEQHRGVHGGDGSAAFTSSLDVLWRESGTKNPRSSRQPPIAASSDLATSDAAKELRGKCVRTFLGHNRPERITPKSSQTPSAPESRKPMNERKLTPKTNGPCLAKIPIRLEPIRPPTTISATTRRLKATSTLCMNSSRPLCTKPTSTCPSRSSSSTSCSW